MSLSAPLTKIADAIVRGLEHVLPQPSCTPSLQDGFAIDGKGGVWQAYADFADDAEDVAEELSCLEEELQSVDWEWIKQECRCSGNMGWDSKLIIEATANTYDDSWTISVDCSDIEAYLASAKPF